MREDRTEKDQKCERCVSECVCVVISCCETRRDQIETSAPVEQFHSLLARVGEPLLIELLFLRRLLTENCIRREKEREGREGWRRAAEERESEQGARASNPCDKIS